MLDRVGAVLAQNGRDNEFKKLKSSNLEYQTALEAGMLIKAPESGERAESKV